MQQFLDIISKTISDEQLFKLTIAKPRNKNDELRNIFIRPITKDEAIQWNAIYRFKTNDQTKNYGNVEMLSEISNQLASNFYNADLYLSKEKVSLLQSKKGKSTVLIKKEETEISIESHDHQKNRLIEASNPFLIDLGISSQNGKVYAHAQDKFKQINRYIEILADLLKSDPELKTVIDMGSGKGYLTFALYDYLSKRNKSILVKGVELRPDLVEKCNVISDKHNFSGLKFELGSIDEYITAKSDVIIALHACDIATDMAIAKGIEANAKYIVVAPCCHKQIRRAMKNTDTALSPLLQHGILKERQAEMITDTIRALILESKGYQVKVFEFISSDHTGKNVMITARKSDLKPPEVISKISALKKEFGIDFHYLETII